MIDPQRRTLNRKWTDVNVAYDRYVLAEGHTIAA